MRHEVCQKSALEPSREIQFLGFIINSRSLKISLSSDKIEKFLEITNYIIQNPQIAIRTLSKLIGMIIAMRPAIHQAPLFTRTIQRELRTALAKNSWDYSQRWHLSSYSLQESQWWQTNIREINGTPIQLYSTAIAVIQTDASLQGWGGIITHPKEVTARGMWSVEERLLHINDLLENPTLGTHPLLQGKPLSLSAWKEGIWKEKAGENLSNTACKLLSNSLASSTNRSYSSALQRFSSWCQDIGEDPYNTSLTNIVNYLSELSEKNLGYNSINIARSAISNAHSHIDGNPIGQHPLVKRILKGLYKTKTPIPRHAATWDVSLVTQYITSLENESVDIQLLTKKLTMLLALSTADRASDMLLYNVNFITVNNMGAYQENKYSFPDSRKSIVTCASAGA